MTVSVLVPTYRRPQDLGRCLQALRAQTRPADEVVVTVREGDEDTRLFLAEFKLEGLPLTVVTVAVPGVVAAMSAGLARATGDLIALTDDDAAPHADWLERIAAAFAAGAGVGGVGGRDRLPWAEAARRVVGKVQWHGRVIGDHHRGVGGPRPVDVLKGVNCAFRAGPLRRVGFDTRLWGGGAQVHWELNLCLSLRRHGWTLLYDPAILVDHFPARRFDDDQRHRFDGPAHRNAVHNETLALLENLPPLRRVAYAGYAVAVGTREAPGPLQIPRLLLARDSALPTRLNATLSGRAGGWKTFRDSGGDP